jgi:hypothetical protein
LVTQTEDAAEIGGPWFFADEGIWTSFDEAAIDLLRAKNATEPRRCFIERVLNRSSAPLFLQSECSG